MPATADKTSPATIGSENGGDRPRETEWMTAAEAVEYAGGVGVCTIREACNRNTLRISGLVAESPGRSGHGENGSPIWLGRWARGGEVHGLARVLSVQRRR